jgi:hypothetical protein
MELVQVEFTGRHLNRHGAYMPGDKASFPPDVAAQIVAGGAGRVITAAVDAPPAHRMVTRAATKTKRPWKPRKRPENS